MSTSITDIKAFCALVLYPLSKTAINTLVHKLFLTSPLIPIIINPKCNNLLPL